MSEEQKNFWKSLPGVLTGVASLLTALITLATVSVSSCRKDEKPPAEPSLANISQCQEITGDWDWFTGGVVTIAPDGALSWKQNPAVAQSLSAVGRWTCLDTKPRSFSLSWQTGLTDVVKLSPDQQSLSGKNLTTGAVITGTRK